MIKHLMMFAYVYALVFLIECIYASRFSSARRIAFVAGMIVAGVMIVYMDVK